MHSHSKWYVYFILLTIIPKLQFVFCPFTPSTIFKQICVCLVHLINYIVPVSALLCLLSWDYNLEGKVWIQWPNRTRPYNLTEPQPYPCELPQHNILYRLKYSTGGVWLEWVWYKICIIILFLEHRQCGVFNISYSLVEMKVKLWNPDVRLMSKPLVNTQRIATPT